MAKIQIDIIDTMGNVTTLPLPNDRPMTALIESIITLADLPAQDSMGRSYTYCLFSRRLLRVLSMDHQATLYTNGVMEGDQLRVTPIPFDTYLEFQMLTEPEKGAVLNLHARPRLTLGRGSDNDIVVRDPIVSRQHGELVWQDGVHIYRDLNSANGSYINNQAVTEPMPLTINSVLSLGEGIRLIYRESTPDRVRASGELKLHGDSQTRTSLTPLPRAGLFVTYAAEEQAQVEPLVAELRKSNFHVFWEAEIPPGSNIQEAIDSNLAYSEILLVCLTAHSVITPYLSDQWNRFIIQNKPIILVQLEECHIPQALNDYPIVAYKSNMTRLTQEIVANIVEILR